MLDNYVSIIDQIKDEVLPWVNDEEEDDIYFG